MTKKQDAVAEVVEALRRVLDPDNWELVCIEGNWYSIPWSDENTDEGVSSSLYTGARDALAVYDKERT